MVFKSMVKFPPINLFPSTFKAPAEIPTVPLCSPVTFLANQAIELVVLFKLTILGAATPAIEIRPKAKVAITTFTDFI